MYGNDWKKVKKFGYYEGISEGGYKGFITDYYKPITIKTKIAFCFLLYDTVKHRSTWETFFNQDRFPLKSYSIYSHIKKKTEKTPDWIKDVRVKTIPTEWCGKSLVKAWIVMLKEAYKDPKNKYFCLLSGECIPLFTFSEIYKKIVRSKKSRINIDYEAEIFLENKLYYADQWVILTRHCAQLLIDLIDTKEGKEYLKYLDKRMCTDVYCSCPDEIYPINWFIHKLGKPSSKGFKKHLRNKVSTYTYWDDSSSKPHPVKFSFPKMKKMRKDICNSGALFGRKFNNKAAKELAMKCNK